MKNGSPVDSASSLIIKVLEASVLAPVSVGILLFAPTVAADELICTVAEDHGSHQYLIDIDDDRGKVIVTNPASIMRFVDRSTSAALLIVSGRLTTLP